MRATEQSGVSGQSVGRAVLLAVLMALAVHLSVLTASASAQDMRLVGEDEAVAAPVALDDGITSETPPADPVPDPEVTSPETVALSGPPATVEAPGPDAAEPAVPPLSELNSPEVPHAGDSTGPAEPSAATPQHVEGNTPPVPDPDATMPAPAAPALTPALAPVAPELPARPRGAAPKRSRADTDVATAAWVRAGSLVSGVTVHAWGAAVTWRPPPVSLPTAPRAKRVASAATENAVEQPSPQQPPHVPRAPSSSLCVGTGSCGSSLLAMLPLFMAIVCLCGSLFERFIEAPGLWRQTRLVSLRERPG